MNRTLLTLAFALALAPAASFAYTGTVRGGLQFFDTRTMTANPGQGPYQHAMRNTWRPVKSARVYLVEEGSGRVIGTSSTNWFGQYSINWSSTTSNPRVRLSFRYESGYLSGGTSRIRMATPSDGTYSAATPVINARNGLVVDIGFGSLGTAAAPDKLATMLQTASEFWISAGTYVPKLQSSLHDVRVQFPVPTASTGLTTDRGHVQMADNWVVFNNSTLAHELGHVAHLVAFDYDWLGADCSWMGNGHSWDGTEWQSCAFTEGFADFVAAATFFTQGASNPASYGNDIENGCSGNGPWTESNVARFFWDVYDSRNESGDVTTQSFAWIVTKLDVFPMGVGTRNTWENFFSKNGTNAWDFYWHSLHSGGTTNVDLVNEVYHNCLQTSVW